MPMKREIPAGEFKSKCLKLMDEVQKDKTHIVITKRGKPVAKLVPVDGEAPQIFGWLKGSVTIHADLVDPLDVQWEANE